MTARIYHNPKCSTSRKTLELLRDNGVEPEVVLYLKNPPSRAELETLIADAGIEWVVVIIDLAQRNPASIMQCYRRHVLYQVGLYRLTTGNEIRINSCAF